MFKLFLESYPFWWESMVVLIFCGAVLGFLGVWAVLKKVVYLPMVFSQISALGIVVGFFGHDHLGSHIDPIFFALVMTLLAALYFSGGRFGGGKGEVTAYLIASAGVLILGTFIRGDLHDMNAILYGNAVLVAQKQLWIIGVGAIAIFAVFKYFYKPFLTVSFDPEGSAAAGLRVYHYNLIIFFSFGVMIALATQALGGLPVFGLMIFPGLMALNITQSMKMAFIVAIIVGVMMGVIGYFIAFVQELPVGATVVAVGAVFYGVSLIFYRQ